MGDMCYMQRCEWSNADGFCICPTCRRPKEKQIATVQHAVKSMKRKYYSRKEDGSIKGVHIVGGYWRAELTIGDKSYNLGSYDDVEQANEARMEADKHINEGNFEKWYAESRSKGRIRINSRWGVKS